MIPGGRSRKEKEKEEKEERGEEDRRPAPKVAEFIAPAGALACAFKFRCLGSTAPVWVREEKKGKGRKEKSRRQRPKGYGRRVRGRGSRPLYVT